MIWMGTGQEAGRKGNRLVTGKGSPPEPTSNYDFSV